MTISELPASSSLRSARISLAMSSKVPGGWPVEQETVPRPGYLRPAVCWRFVCSMILLVRPGSRLSASAAALPPDSVWQLAGPAST
jgi:hypothetical protein